MKKLAQLLWVGVILMIAAAPVFADPQVLKINAPPSLWVQQEGRRLSGPAIEILREALRGTEFTLEAQELPWARALRLMEDGGLDIIPVIFKTEARQQTMAFSRPYLVVPTVIMTRIGEKGVKGPADLEGRRGAVVKGDSLSSKAVKMIEGLEVIEVSSYAQLVKMISFGRADYALVPLYASMVEARRLGLEQHLHFLAPPLAERELHFAFSKKSPHLNLLPRLDQAIQDMQADGRLDQLVTKAIAKEAAR